MFFQSLNIIFNSEERKKFFQKNESKFEDENFGHESGTKNNMFFSKSEELNNKYLLKKGFSINDIFFERLSDLYPDYDLFEKEINCNQFKQTYLGDCYFIDCLSLISNYSQLITQLFRFDKKRKDGYYEIYLFVNGEWQIIILDDYIPVIKINNKKVPYGVTPAENCKCYYFCLLEKAWAKINGSYIDIIGGWGSQTFECLTGFKTQIFNHSEDNLTNFFYKINKSIHTYNHLISTVGNNTKIKEYVGQKLWNNNDSLHAYSIHDAFQIKDKITNIKLNVLKCRNPWGTNIGNKKTILPNNFKNDEIEDFKKEEDNGFFIIDMKNYFQLFTHTEFCYTKFGHHVQTYRFYNFYDNNENEKKIKTSGNFFLDLN